MLDYLIEGYPGREITVYWQYRLIRRQSSRAERAESSRDKNATHEPYLGGVGWKGEPAVFYVTPDLSYATTINREGGREKGRVKVINEMRWEKKKK